MGTDNSKLWGHVVSLPSVPSPPAIPLFAPYRAFALAAPARSKDPPQSVVEAARNARERKANSTKHPKIITNTDLGVPYSAPTVSAFDLHSSSSYADEESYPPMADCDNPRAASLAMELQDAQQELEQIRYELSYQPEVIPNGDLDLQYLQPGYPVLYFHSPPLLTLAPPVPARVAEAELEERIASLE